MQSIMARMKSGIVSMGSAERTPISSADDAPPRRESADPLQFVVRSPGWPFPISLPVVFVKFLGDYLAIRPGRRHPADELSNLLGKSRLPLGRQDFADRSQPPLDTFARLDQRLLSGLSTRFSATDVPSDFFHSRANTPRFLALPCSIDAVSLG